MTNKTIMDYWPIKSEPRPMQVEVLKWAEKQTAKYLVVQAPVGCHTKDTHMLMFDGSFRRVDTLKVFDRLMGPDSKPRTITNLHYGNDIMYTINGLNGDSFTVNSKHLVSVINKTDNTISHIEAEQLFTRMTKYISKAKYELFYPKGIDFPAIDAPSVDPYELGRLLTNPLDPYIRKTNYVFPSIKLNTKEVRTSFLCGFIDNHPHCTIDIDNCNIKIQDDRLRKDIIFIAKSLGLMVKQRKGFNTIDIIGVFIRDDDTDKLSIDPLGVVVPSTSFSITKEDEQPYYGVTVDGDNLYVLDNFIVTHNCGKSLIGVTLSRYLADSLGDSFILTPQKILQDQYNQSFQMHGLVPLYGKGNYECKTRNTTCDIGSVMKKKCDACPHKQAKDAAIASNNMSLNYKLALLYFSMDEEMSKINPRTLAVFDEAHVLEQQLVDYDAIEITKQRVEGFHLNYNPSFKSMDDAHQWLISEYEPALSRHIALMSDNAEDLARQYKLTKEEERTLREYNSLSDHLGVIKWLCNTPVDQVNIDRVLVQDELAVTFKSITAKKAFNRVLRDKADRMLFMSATINPRQFCDDLGLDPDDVAYYELQSDFPVENRQVFYMPQLKMNASWTKPENQKSRELMLENICNLLDMHESDSGIIHTANFKISDWIVKELSKKNIPHNVYHHNPSSGDSRDSVIDAYQQQAEAGIPSLLISPSITEGLDLYEDRGRFAIFAKINFPNLGDQWVKRRLEMSRMWYNYQAIIQTMQGCGRVVRSNTDHGNVYILDASWGYLYNQMRHIIPQWWNDAYIEV